MVFCREEVLGMYSSPYLEIDKSTSFRKLGSNEAKRRLSAGKTVRIVKKDKVFQRQHLRQGTKKLIWYQREDLGAQTLWGFSLLKGFKNQEACGRRGKLVLSQSLRVFNGSTSNPSRSPFSLSCNVGKARCLKQAGVPSGTAEQGSWPGRSCMLRAKRRI